MRAWNGWATLSLGLFCAGLTGCPEKKTTPPAAGAPVAVPGTAEAAKPPAQVASPQALAEVEVFGAIEGGAGAAKYLVFIARTPCDPVALMVDRVGATEFPSGAATNFFIEVFVPQGTRGHLCAAAIDEQGRMMAFGGYGKNPLAMQGEGEVVFQDAKIKLEPVSPRKLPKGL